MPTRFWSSEASSSSSRLTNSSSSSLSPPSAAPSSSSSISPPSSRSLTPPPRLHLRSLLLSPPLPKEHWSRAPKMPYPWIWRCHLCNACYRLGVTRRCLEDGHFFCSIPERPPSLVSPIDNSQDVTDMFFAEDSEEADELRRRKADREKLETRMKATEKKRKGKSRKKASKGCGAEFDYVGWARYNTWRREMQTLKHPSSFSSKPPARGPQHSRIERIKHWAGLAISDEGEVVGAGRRKRPKRNCWKDCDFPSECLKERQAEREWEVRIRLERLREARDREAKKLREEWWRANEEDLGLGVPLRRTKSAERNMSSVVEWTDVIYDTVERKKAKEEDKMHGKETLHSGHDTAVVLDRPNLGPLGTDCDGLGESAFQTPYVTARRRKSVGEEKGESPPSSPLKCSFDFDDVDLGGHTNDVPEAKAMDIGGRDGDLQLREESASWESNIFLRRAEAGDERFGDEVNED